MSDRRDPHLVLHGCGADREFSIPEGMAWFGRSSRNPIPLPDASVSRLHGYLVRDGRKVKVFDASSENGVKIGRKPARGQELRPGDVIRVGRLRLVYRDPRFVEPLDPPPIRPNSSAPQQETGPRPIATTPPPATFRITPPPAPPIPPPAPSVAVPRPRRRSRTQRLAMPLIAASAFLAITLATIVGGMPDSTHDEAELHEAHNEASALRHAIDRLQGQIVRRDDQLSALRRRHSDRLEEIRSDRARALDALRTAQVDEAARIQEEIEEISQQRDELAHRLALLQQAEKENPVPPTTQPAAEESKSASPPTPESTGVAAGSLPEARDSVVTSIRRAPPKVDLDALSQAIREVLDEYADPTIEAGKIEPPLSRLVDIRTMEAVEKLLEIYDYGKGILDYIVRHERTLHNRAEILLSGGSIDGVGRKVEERQRALDGLDKKSEILARQRPRLAGMIDALVRGIGRMHPTGSTRILTRRLENERDPTLRQQILRCLINVRAHDSIPFLIARIPSGQDEYRAQIVEALRKITGEDAGSTRAEWNRWWKENANRFKEV